MSDDPSTKFPAPDLPKRLFRDLKPRVRHGKAVPWSEEDKPLPFLRYLFYLYHLKHVLIEPPTCDRHEGYALGKAVRAGFEPLVRFLLANRADPRAMGAIPVLIAIQRKDLKMVRLLVEGDLSESSGAKRRRVPDRVVCNREMLQMAAKVGAQDILQYLLVKGVTPNMQTFRLLHSNGYC